MADLNFHQHGAQLPFGAQAGNKLAVNLANPAHHAAFNLLPALDRQLQLELAALGSDGDSLILNIVQLRGL